MTLTREHGVWALVAAVLLGGGIWFARHTEWVDEEVRDPPTGELRRDRDLRLKQVIAKLGVKVVTPGNLDRLPPAGATLVLSSWNWNIFPEREAALRRWVEAGGRLVVPNFGFTRGGFDWVPAKVRAASKATPPAAPGASSPASASRPGAPARPARPDNDDEDDDEAEAPGVATASSANPVATATAGSARCPGINEPVGVTPAFAFPRGYATCIYTGSALVADVPPLWALDGSRGHVIVRVPVGRGQVTVSGIDLPFGNDDLLEHDNALIAIATLQPRAGGEVWLVREEARPPLLAFLWTNGAPAVLLALAALAFALWRGARRFGPRIAIAPPARRSMREQIRGTAGFIAHRGSPALHAAQLRALNDAAAPRIRGFDAMAPAPRAQAIATLAGMDPTSLAHAMNPALNATPTRHPAAALALIETARRRLLNTARQPAPSPESR